MGSPDDVVKLIDAEMNGRKRGYADARGELLFQARDTIERLTAALREIEIEATRPKGNWVHLRRVIALNATRALNQGVDHA